MSAIDHKFETGEAADVEDAEAVASEFVQPVSRENWLASMPLAKKLNLAVFGNTLILAVIAGVILYGTSYFSERGFYQAALTSIEVRSNNAAIALNEAGNDIEVVLTSDNRAAQQAALSEATASLDYAQGAVTDPITFAGDLMPDAEGALLAGFLTRIEALQVALADAGTDRQALLQVQDDAEALSSEIGAFAIGYHGEVAATSDRLFDTIASTLIVFIIMVVVGVAVSVLCARHVIRDVTGMVRNLTGSMEAIAAGDSEGRIPGVHRSDEIGSMARALEIFRASAQKLRNLTNARASEVEEQLAEQQKISDQMRELRREKGQILENMADGFEVSVGELITAVSAASEQLNATSKQMVSLADTSNDQAENASEAMEKATANVTAAAAATDEFALSIGEISRQASASAALARDASKHVSSANSRMSELSLAADEIGEIVELIQTIAQRTNLLALNASIEAARGGEAGRGFAVVASEVKELAMQTSNATNSVTERITAMQDSSRSSADDLTSIVDQIGELEQAAVMIASAVDQQSVSGEELARNIDTVASGSAQVAERLVSLRAASGETEAAAGDVVESARALGNHAEDLRSKAGRFIADVRRSAHDLEAGEKELSSAARG